MKNTLKVKSVALYERRLFSIVKIEAKLRHSLNNASKTKFSLRVVFYVPLLILLVFCASSSNINICTLACILFYLLFARIT